MYIAEFVAEIACLSGSWLMGYSCHPSAKDIGQIVPSSAKPWDVPVGRLNDSTSMSQENVTRPCNLGHVFIWSSVEVNFNLCMPHVISQSVHTLP